MNRRLLAAALLVFALTFLYRFATLGGALGGFDDDHFMQLAFAAQIEAGERPWRDYQGVSLQGVWPSIGFVMSAEARRFFGDNLRSEALMTAGVLAVAAAATLCAAAMVAPLPWAVLTTLLTVLLEPKLYAFPKLVVLSGAVLLILLYARRPTWPRGAGLGALTAAAFLFRHDYAVYVAVGLAILFAGMAFLDLRRSLRHALVTAAVAGVLLTPSLILLQRTVGIVNYFEFARENASREADRTELSVPAPSADADAETNAIAWSYWLFVLVPPVAGIRALVRARQWEPWRTIGTLAIAACAGVAIHFLLRGNLGARLGDVGPLVAVLGAGLCAPPPDGVAGGWRYWPQRAGVLLIFAASIMAVWIVGSVSQQLKTTGWPNWPVAAIQRAGRVSAELRDLPQSIWTAEGLTGSMLAAQYVHQCTRETDRLLMLSYAPEVIVFSGRLFAAGVSTPIITANTDAIDRSMVARLQAQSVPLALLEPEQLPPLVGIEGRSEAYFPRLYDYLREVYAVAGTMGEGDQYYYVLASRVRVPAGTFRGTGLPCFR